MEAPARPGAKAPVADEQLAALREEIRRVSRSYGWLYWTGIAWTVLDPLVLLPLCFYYRHRDWPLWLTVAGISWIVGLFILGWTLGARLTRCRKQIAARLALVEPEARARVLLALKRQRWPRGPTREIVHPFTRPSAGVAELLPSTAPTSRGDEPTPAADG